MTPSYSQTPQETKHNRYSREDTVQKVLEFEQERIHVSQRAFAKEYDLPRTTLQHWLKRKNCLQQVDEAATAFFETPEGLEWLHRIVAAAQFVITQLAGGSVRQLSLFLQMSQLDSFVASSTGTQHQAITAMEQALCQFGQQERERLAPQMPHRQLTLAEDETFHPDICLVALDVTSGFLLVERYSEKRDASSWNEAINEATSNLNVSVLQCVSDQARALIAHAEQGLGVYHSPDLFHVQHELSKATSLPLAGQVRQAPKALEQAHEKSEALFEQKKRYKENIDKRGPGRPPDWEKRIAVAQEAEETARAALTEAQKRQEEVRAALRGLSHDYHPFDLLTGALKGAEQVRRQLTQRFQTIERVAEEASLSTRTQKKISRAQGCLPRMVATIAFFLQLIASRVLSLDLSCEEKKVFLNQLLPAFYLRKVARQQRLAEERESLLTRAEELLRPWQQRDGPSAAWDEDTRSKLEAAAQEWAEDFARSSSCTEGRNAHLRQRHQSSHRLSLQKLGAATVIHNYFISRSDGSTAAERFFGQKPKDLFIRSSHEQCTLRLSYLIDPASNFLVTSVTIHEDFVLPTCLRCSKFPVAWRSGANKQRRS